MADVSRSTEQINKKRQIERALKFHPVMGQKRVIRDDKQHKYDGKYYRVLPVRFLFVSLKV